VKDLDGEKKIVVEEEEGDDVPEPVVGWSSLDTLRVVCY
jgi:hypothetical protein